MLDASQINVEITRHKTLNGLKAILPPYEVMLDGGPVGGFRSKGGVF